MSAPPGWKFGDPLTQEMKDKMAEGRRRAAEKKAHKKERPPRPRPERAPDRTGILGLTQATRRKVISLIERLLGAMDAGAGWTMRRMTRPVYKLTPDGQPFLDTDGRQIIEAHVRAFTDETIALDRLEEWERRWLAEELSDELLRYKTLRAWLLRMVDLEERSSLPICVTILALPRLARHGVIPTEFQTMAQEMREAARRQRRVPKAEPVAPAPEPEVASAAAD